MSRAYTPRKKKAKFHVVTSKKQPMTKDELRDEERIIRHGSPDMVQRAFYRIRMLEGYQHVAPNFEQYVQQQFPLFASFLFPQKPCESLSLLSIGQADHDFCKRCIICTQDGGKIR